MRLAALSFPLLTLALAGCQAFAPEPDVATLPHAAVQGTHLDVDNDRVDTFRVLTINGRNVLPISDQPAKLIGIDATNLLPAGRGVHVEIEGLAFYSNTVRRLFWDPLRAQGGVDFVPTAGATYVVRGTIAPELSTVWLEDAATHAVIGQKVSVTRAVAAPDVAASAAAQ